MNTDLHDQLHCDLHAVPGRLQELLFKIIPTFLAQEVTMSVRVFVCLSVTLFFSYLKICVM